MAIPTPYPRPCAIRSFSGLRLCIRTAAGASESCRCPVHTRASTVRMMSQINKDHGQQDENADAGESPGMVEKIGDSREGRRINVRPVLHGGIGVKRREGSQEVDRHRNDQPIPARAAGTADHRTPPARARRVFPPSGRICVTEIQPRMAVASGAVIPSGKRINTTRFTHHLMRPAWIKDIPRPLRACSSARP